ncbi:MAG: Fe(3+) dicitrate transport ATP-binding protein FecE [candidate division WS2 bacterium]|nr:Fe(3+) dicitrate transport ATP-binding protein FecE [Candidatus Lithacetigena glycinireducens]
MINTDHLTFYYQGNKTVLKNLDLIIAEQKGIVGVIGENGSGKSTLLKLFARILKPIEGKIYIDGFNYLKFTQRDFSRLVSFLGPGNHLDLAIPVLELIKFGRYTYLPFLSPLTKEDLRIIDWAIDMVDMRLHISRKLTELSSGEKQRARLAMSLAQNTRIILLDEPTTFLDPRHWVKIMEVLKEVAKEKLVLIASHDLNFLKLSANYLFCLKEGQVIYQGLSRNFWDSSHFVDVFGVDSQKLKSN